MSQAQDEQGGDVARLLAGAARAIASVRYCWLATMSEGGLVSARPMGRTPSDLDEDEWTIRFVTDGRSRKASEIWRVDKVAVIFQREADDAYIALIGAARLRMGASEDRRHWRDAYEVYFPTAEARANAAFIEINVERMDLWIRGVTPEPFGLRPTKLERGSTGWRQINY